MQSIDRMTDQFVHMLLLNKNARLRSSLHATILDADSDERSDDLRSFFQLLEEELVRTQSLHPLYENIRKSFAYEAERRAQSTESAEDATRAMQSFVGSLPRIILQLAEDAEAAYKGDPAAKGNEEIIATYPGFAVNKTYRMAHALHTQGVPYIPRMMSEYAHGTYGADIHPGAVIGRRFFIDHVTKVVIGETAVIGNDVKIYHGVTLGAVSLADAEGLRESGEKRHPTVGNNVVIYSDATILGGKTHIGDGGVIGAGARLLNIQTGRNSEFGANATGFSSSIGDESKIKSNTAVSYSRIGSHNTVGPNATVSNAITEEGVTIEANAAVHGKRGSSIRIGHDVTIEENAAITDCVT